jgi:hypothetical protein
MTHAIGKHGGSWVAMHTIEKGGGSRATSVGHLGLPYLLGQRGGYRRAGITTAVVEVRDTSRMGMMRRKSLHAQSGSTVVGVVVEQEP